MSDRRYDAGMTLLRRLAAALLALLAIGGMLAVTSAPAQAWSYCSPNTTNRSPAASIRMFDQQGYCGTEWYRYPAAATRVAGTNYTVCVNLTGNENDRIASIKNESYIWSGSFYKDANCSNVIFVIREGSKQPNLYAFNGDPAINVADMVSSVRYYDYVS
jgi:hypothetical protein